MKKVNRRIPMKIDFCREIGGNRAIPIIKTDKGYYIFDYTETYLGPGYYLKPVFFKTKKEIEEWGTGWRSEISYKWLKPADMYIVDKIKKENPHMNILEVGYFESKV